MAPTNNAPDLSAIAAGDRVAIRLCGGSTWSRHYSWTTTIVERVTAARITAGGRTYRRSDGMRLGDGGPHQAAYLFPYDHPAAVKARHENAMDAARDIIARACGEAAAATRRGESVDSIRSRLAPALSALTRLEQLQAQAPTPTTN